MKNSTANKFAFYGQLTIGALLLMAGQPVFAVFGLLFALHHHEKMRLYEVLEAISERDTQAARSDDKVQ